MDYIMSKDPNMKKTINKIIRSVMKKAEKKMEQGAKGLLESDPRSAHKAVRSLVYKRIFGGNLNIISKRRAGNTRVNVQHQGTLRPGQRGGNRRPISAETLRRNQYWGEDRGFILRWVNEGTKNRRIQTQNNTRNVNRWIGRGHTSASLESKRNGNRGSIQARRWFGPASEQALYDMSQILTETIDELIVAAWGDGALGSTHGYKGNNIA